MAFYIPKKQALYLNYCGKMHVQGMFAASYIPERTFFANIAKIKCSQIKDGLQQS